MSVPQVLMQLWSVLMSVTPIITEDQEDRIAQSWTRPSLTAILGRTGSTLTSTVVGLEREGPCNLPGQHNRADA